MVGYATGQTDEWRGTGVWSGLSLKRDDNNKADDETKKQSTPDNASTKKEELKQQPAMQEQK